MRWFGGRIGIACGQAVCQTAADVDCRSRIVHELHPPEHDKAAECVGPAIFVFHALVNDGERRAGVLPERIGLVSGFGAAWK